MAAAASAIRFGGALVRRGRSAAAISVNSAPTLGVLSGVLPTAQSPSMHAQQQSVGGGLLLDLNSGSLGGGPAAALGATRTAVTKSRRRRDAKKKRRARLAELGIEQKPPSWHIPRDTPIVNALSKEERSRESREYDQKASALMKEKIGRQDEVLRFDFTGLRMSDRVRKLFDLTNGSQKEVVKAQKKRGMELFQLREGDTGSSAVQVIALTTRIQQLQTHMAKHKKDKHSKRGMDALYVRRRKLLDYMERKDYDSYRRVVKTLGLIR